MVPLANYGTHLPGWALRAVEMTALLKHLDPKPWPSTALLSFAFGELSEDSALPSPSLGRKEGKRLKASWAITSQQLLVSKIWGREAGSGPYGEALRTPSQPEDLGA